MERDPSPCASSQTGRFLLVSGSHPVCTGQGSFPVSCCQTFGSPRLAAAPACSLSSPRSRSAADSPQPAGCPRPVLSRCSPPPPLPLSRDTHTPASATGNDIRPREVSEALPADSRLQREAAAPPPGAQGAPTSQDAAILPRRMSHDPAAGGVSRGVACAAPRDTGVWREAGPGPRDNGAKMAAGGLSARCGAAAARAEGTRGQGGGGPGCRLRADPAPRDRRPRGAGGEGAQRGAGRF